MKNAAEKLPESLPSGTVAEPAPRVVYTQAPVQLGVLAGRDGEAWRVRVGRDERVLTADPSVDPRVLEEALASGARVVIDAAGEPVIAGVLTVRPALSLDRDGAVRADVERLEINARREVLLRTPEAFVQLGLRDVEVYGSQLLCRAREVFRVLGRMVKIN